VVILCREGWQGGSSQSTLGFLVLLRNGTNKFKETDFQIDKTVGDLIRAPPLSNCTSLQQSHHSVRIRLPRAPAYIFNFAIAARRHHSVATPYTTGVKI